MNITRQTSSELFQEYDELKDKLVALDIKISNKIKSLITRYNKCKPPTDAVITLPSDYFIYDTSAKIQTLKHLEFKLKPFEPVQLKMDL